MRIRQTYKRRGEKRAKTPLILVVCEDRNIEPAYFNKLKEEYSNILERKGNNRTDPVKIVRRAISERIKLMDAGKISPHSQTWCVFDVDDNTQQQIYDALALAKQNNINIALSNPCIEFWFLCHFTKSSRECTAAEALTALKNNEECSTYTKTINNFAQLNEFLCYVSDRENIETAIKNASEINKIHQNEDKYHISRNPSTNITELIEKILEE